MMRRKVKVVVIGAGTAGLSACREIGKFTDDFVLIHYGPHGTSCILAGCMPAKQLNYSAKLFHKRHNMHQFGIDGAEDITLDIPRALRHVRAMRDHFRSSLMPVIDALKPHIIEGFAHFISPNEVQVGNTIIKAENIIIATGSTPYIPPEWHGFDKFILTSNTIFDQQDFPRHMAVIGQHILGVEMAQTLKRLGVDVTAVGADSYIGGLTDPAVNRYAIATLREEMPLWVGHKAILACEGDHLRVTAGGKTVVVDKALVAIGRVPNIHHMGLEALGIIRGQKFDYDPDTMRVRDFPVYVAGDVKHSVLYEARDEGKIAGFNAVHHPECSFRRRTRLKIVYTQPTIATIGKNWAELDHHTVATGEATFNDQGSAKIAAENKGIMHIYADTQSGMLLGAELFVPEGEHLAHLVAWLIEMRLTVHQALHMPFYHPTVEEAIRTALLDLRSKLDVPAMKATLHEPELV
jgi:dihydrolipoamide dehydrogenase